MDRQCHEGTCFRLIDGTNDKPLLVLIHGVGLNQDMWLPWIDILRQDCRILTYDFWGHGESDNPPGDRKIADFASQLQTLMRHLGVRRFALAGYSMGALISQAFAFRHETVLSHLILLHSVYQRTEAQCAGVRERYRMTREQGPMATVELAIERWFSASYRQYNPDKMEQIRTIFRGHTDDGYLKAYRLFAFAENEMQHYPVHHVPCPALVVTGSDDTGSLPRMSMALGRDLPAAQVIINQGHRHGAPYEFASTMAQQLKAFLNTH